MSKNLQNLSERNGLDHGVYNSLNKNSIINIDPKTVETKVSNKPILINDATMNATASCYDFLKKSDKNKKAYVCSGSACLLAGTQEETRQILQQRFNKNEIGEIVCLGRCYENHAYQIDDKNYSGSDIKFFNNQQKSNQDSHENNNYFIDSKLKNPILTAKFPGMDHYKELVKKLLKGSKESALEEIKASKLRGRGGAGFPAGFKWESCKNEKSNIKYIISNADEGDPGAFSDRFLMEQRPHLILFGMLCAGFIVGAKTGIHYVRAEYPESIKTLQDAITDFYNAGLLGNNILGSDFDFTFKIAKGAGAYICGEETALINSLEGGRPEVRTRPPFPTTKGLFGKPTIVNNIETYASIPFIIENGGKAYSEFGTAKSSGTKLVCLDGFFNHPGVVEVEMGTSFNEIFNEIGGGFKQEIKAIQIGGPLGGIIPSEKFNQLNLDFESLDQAGFLLGHASVICIPKDFSILEFLHHLCDFSAHESCGKCYPCRLGTTRMTEMLTKALKDPSYKINSELFKDLLETLETGSLCALGGGIPLPIQNALTYFKTELTEYFDKEISL